MSAKPAIATNAYRAQAAVSPTSASTEAWALIEAARRMSDASNKPEERDALVTAIRLNWRLWTILQVDLMSDENPMPEEIRVNLLNLSNFIDRHTVELLSDPDPAKVEVLISINRNIAAGLIEGANKAMPDVEIPLATDDRKVEPMKLNV